MTTVIRGYRQDEARHDQARHDQARHDQARHDQARHDQARHGDARQGGRGSRIPVRANHGPTSPDTFGPVAMAGALLMAWPG